MSERAFFAILEWLGVAFAAFCILLTVRILNRRERWAKWTLAGVIGVPVLYVMSFGPACWISRRLQPSGKVVSAIYLPIVRVMWRGRPYVVQGALMHYVEFGAPRGHAIDYTGIEFH